MCTEVTAVANIFNVYRRANRRLEAHHYDQLADKFWHEANQALQARNLPLAVELLEQSKECLRAARELDHSGQMTTAM